MRGDTSEGEKGSVKRVKALYTWQNQVTAKTFRIVWIHAGSILRERTGRER